MGKRNYTHVQTMLPEIKTMLAEGKTRQEVAEHYGFQDKQVVKKLLERERARQRKLEAGIIPRPKGRSRKPAIPGDVVSKQAYEIQRLGRPEKDAALAELIAQQRERSFHTYGYRRM